MVWKIDRSPRAIADLSEIYDFLVRANLEFGEPKRIASKRADDRIREILTRTEEMAAAPFQGTLRPDFGPGVRNVTKGRAVIYFQPDEATQTLRILAIFWGGQDHAARMADRSG